MFVKWPKIYRILVSQIDVKGKHYHSDEEVKLLLAGEVSIQEKVDGANCAIIRTKDGFRFQKRGGLVGQSEHPQFGALIAWGQINYDKLIQIPENTMIYGEWCWATHTIFYDSLPDYFLGFAIYNYKDRIYYHRDQLTQLCDKIGINYTPEITRGHFNKNELFDLIPKLSNFSTTEKAEGIVIQKLKDNSRGKVVRAEFVKKMESDEHWSKYNVKKNLLKKT